MVDKGRSMGTLGGAANLFGELRGELMDTKALIDRTHRDAGPPDQGTRQGRARSRRLGFFGSSPDGK